MPKKKASKGRRKTNKGSPFEREIARRLSLWWSDGASDDLFWRTAGSGGRATNRAKQGKSTANGGGDICAQTKEAQNLLDLVTFEIKRGYSTATISDLLDIEGGGVMGKFIEQARRSASIVGTPYWAVIHKRDRRESLMITNCTFLVPDWNHFVGIIDRNSRPDADADAVYTAKLDECLTPVVAKTIRKAFLGKTENEIQP